MNKNSAPMNRIYASIAVAFGWLIFLSLWLFYYATSFGIIQNIGVLLASIVVVGMFEVVIWVPWAMKQSE
ncbi:MAG TPA: hypothetical protein VF324_08375 [Methanobacterium sp.]